VSIREDVQKRASLALINTFSSTGSNKFWNISSWWDSSNIFIGTWYIWMEMLVTKEIIISIQDFTAYQYVFPLVEPKSLWHHCLFTSLPSLFFLIMSSSLKSTLLPHISPSKVPIFPPLIQALHIHWSSHLPINLWKEDFWFFKEKKWWMRFNMKNRPTRRFSRFFRFSPGFPVYCLVPLQSGFEG